MRPIYRFASLKMARSIHLESSLEHEVAMLLDGCHTVETFGEQPVRMQFDNGERMEVHFPDFALTHHGHPWFLEIKFWRDVDQRALQRTQRLRDLLCPLGIGYRLITEKDLPAGARLSNAWALLQRGRMAANQHLSLLTSQRVAHAPGITLGELGWGNRLNTASLALDLIQGRLHADFGAAISQGTCVWPTKIEGNWLWA